MQSSYSTDPELTGWRRRYADLDRAIAGWMARVGIVVLRLGLGVVFLWFGILKFVPGLSPAEDLATRTIESLTLGAIEPGFALIVLAAWESLIGLGFLSGRFLRATIALLVVQMLGAAAPLVLFPEVTFTQFPFAPTLVGQYIIKNIVLVGAAMVIGATMRGGAVVPRGAAGTGGGEAAPRGAPPDSRGS